MSEDLIQVRTTEKISDLPRGWVLTKIGEITEKISNGITARQNKEGNGIPVTRIETISEGKIDLDRVGYLDNLSPELINKYKLYPGDILFSHINSDLHLGKTAIYNKDNLTLVHGMNLLLIRTYRDIMITSYLNYLCNHYRHSGVFISIAQHAVNQSSINQAKLKNINVPLPPLREQHRIVEKIEELFTNLDAGIDSLKKAQAQLKRYRQSVLKSAVEGKLTEEWREAHEGELEPASVLLERILKERREKWEAEQLEMFDAKGKVPKDGKWKGRYPEPTLPDKTQLPRLPEEWVWATMDSITVQGPQNGLYLPQSKYGKGVPILRIDDYQDGWSKISGELKLVDVTPAQKEKYQLTIGDLVINRVNSMTHLGKCINISERNLPSLFESNMMKLRVAEIMGPSYVEFYLRSVLGRSQLTKNAKWAVNQASINQKDVLRAPVPLPPLDEQKLIVEEVSRCLSVADEIESTIGSELKRAERLRQSILKQAFSGKLVPQDPSDEPATVLLERIKAEKAKREKPAKRSKEPQQMKLF